MNGKLPTARSDWALFLDIDGTVLDIAVTPDAVVVPAELRADLGALEAAFDGALALVSGRSIAKIDHLFTPLVLPAAGEHGAEMRFHHELMRIPPSPELVPVIDALDAYAATRPGILVERKDSSVAIHYRLAPHLHDEVAALVRNLVGPEDQALEVLPARQAFDIKPRHASKGAAIEWFLARPPFAGRIPVFAGDDVSDETGFAAVNARGGHSIKVGIIGDTEARLRARSAAEMRDWLAACVAALAQEDGWRE